MTAWEEIRKNSGILIETRSGGLDLICAAIDNTESDHYYLVIGGPVEISSWGWI